MFTQLLYSLSSPVLLLTLWLIYILYALIGSFVVECLFKHQLSAKDSNALGPMSGLTNTMFAILGAFVAVGALTTYRNVQTLVQQEAAAVSAIYHSAFALPNDLRNEIQSDIIAYANTVVNVEWPSMCQEKYDVSAQVYLDRMLQQADKYHITTQVDYYIVSQTIDQIFSLYEVHRQRADSVNASLEVTTWVVLIIISIVAVSLNFFYIMQSRLMKQIALTFIAIVVASLIFLITMYDHPYLGEVSIKPKPLKEFLKLIAVTPQPHG